MLPAVDAFIRVAAPLRDGLGRLAVAVEHIGSTAVLGLVAKPILDVAVGLDERAELGAVKAVFESLGYRFRGDKGDDGGLLFVLEDRPAHRIAHVHVVGFGDRRWRRYLTFRDRLRADERARNS